MGCTSSVPDVDDDGQKQSSQEQLKAEENDKTTDLPSSLPSSPGSNNKEQNRQKRKRDRLESLSDAIVETKMTLIPQISQTVPQFLICDEDDNSKHYLNEKHAILLAFGFCRRNNLLLTNYNRNHGYNHRHLNNNNYNNFDRYIIAKLLKRYLYNDTCIVRSLSDHSIKSLLLDPLFIKRKNRAQTRKIHIQFKV